MKKIYMLCIALISLQYSYSQLIILDEAPEGISGVFNDLVVYDNDIIYNKSIDGTNYSPRVFNNLGAPNTSIDINSGKNQALQLKQLVTDFHLRQNYNGGYYDSGNKIFGQGIPNATTGSKTVYQLNKSRTLFITNNSGLKSLDQAGNHTLVSQDTIFGANGTQNYAIKTLHSGLIKEINLSSEYNDDTYGGYFLYNNTLHFYASLDGKFELYSDNSFGLAARITNLSIGTGGTGPQYSFPSNSGIWFNGQYNIYNGNGSISYLGRELCYANGDVNLGSSETPAGSENDGSTGYLAFETGLTNNGNYSGSSPVIFGEVNNKVIYYAQNTNMRKLYAYPGNIDLNIPSYVFTDNGSTNFGTLNNKLYMIFRVNNFSSTPCKLYIIDGTTSGTQIIELPEFATSISNFMVYNNLIYFIANSKLIKFNPTNQTFETLFQGNGLITQVTPYQNGFVFIQQESNIAPYGRKLMGWNIEQRQLIHDTGNSNKSSKTKAAVNYSLNYDSINYNVSIDNLTIPITDKIKIQLLDKQSSQKEFITGDFPQNAGEINADIFYALNTFTDGNNHISEIGFGYDEAMFPNISNFNPQNLKLYLFQNNTAQEIPFTLDLVSKTLKVNTNFEDESFVYFAYTNSLSLKDTHLSDTFSLYPNPTNSELNIKSELLKNNFNIKITNVLGAIVLSAKNTKKIDVSNLPMGMYFIQIEQDNYSLTKKFLKK
jgi:hypothetical protein